MLKNSSGWCRSKSCFCFFTWFTLLAENEWIFYNPRMPTEETKGSLIIEDEYPRRMKKNKQKQTRLWLCLEIFAAILLSFMGINDETHQMKLSEFPTNLEIVVFFV